MTYPLHIFLIAIPLVLQTYLIFGIGYVGVRLFKVPYGEAAPATMIGASNFFELSVATALVLYGMNSGSALANGSRCLDGSACHAQPGSDHEG